MSRSPGDRVRLAAAEPSAYDPVAGPCAADLTTPEKVLLVEGVDAWNTHEIPRLGVRSLRMTDGPHGVRNVRDAAGGFDISNNAPSTAFPPSVTLASTWNPDLATTVGEAIGRECRDAGVDVLLGPGINIKRSPLCGRNFEYYSEDPLLTGAVGAAFVTGLQQVGGSASLKHFAANSNENFRFVGDSLVDERALREIYLRAFEQVVKKAKPDTVMCSYNAVNGTPASQNHELLTSILRDEWGFDGVVVTDWGATRDRVAGVAAGCDLDMPGEVAHNRVSLRKAIDSGSLSLADLDRSVDRVLRLANGRAALTSAPHDPVQHALLAEQVAREGATLLANDGTLPLELPAPGLLVVGELFEALRFQGAGSSLINPTEVVSPKAAFDRRGIAYAYERGFRSLDAEPDQALIDAAVDAAGKATTVVLFAGLTDFEESEGFDRATMELASNQRHLIDALLDTGTPIVLVLFAGAPVELPAGDRFAAVLTMHLPGMRGGEAAAALLFGEANPSGRLAESWPRTAAEASAHDDFGRGPTSRYYESIYVGYRFYDKAQVPVRFPFGHGLSYTTFDFRDPELEVIDGSVTVRLQVANTGRRDGAEVVQLYVRNAPSAVFKADKELHAFAKVEVAAGQTELVQLTFALADLAHWDVREHGWVLSGGEYEICLAASATDIRCCLPLVVPGPPATSPYPPLVDRDYATPPRSVPASFPDLLGRPVPTTPGPSRLTLDSRLEDGRRWVVGRILYGAVLARVRWEHRRARRLPESLERDTRVKNTYFLIRMMPTISLRAMVMTSRGAMPYELALALTELASGHPLRALRALRRRPDHRGAS